MMLILLLSVVVLAVLNLKFNILLSGLLPDVAFSFKGNAIYYLALTRGVLFLFFFYCFRGYSSNLVFWGAVIASIASIGVLSRMVIVFYFAVVFVQILQALPGWRIREVAVNILFFLAILAGFSYLTVLGSSGVRDIIYTKISMQQKQEVAPVEPAAVDTGSPLIVAPPVSLTQAFNFKEKLGVYKGLAMGRWIGMEGVMAVHAYPSKSFAFLWEALKEKSYHGSPFYHMVLIPGYVPDSAVGRLFSASVPGPIAFAYYSGSFIFVFLALFLAAYFMSGIEYLAIKFFDEAQPAVLFISSFMVADFFQFGIAPQSFVKYWVFSFAAIAAFVFLTGLRKPPPLADCAPVKLR